MQACISHFLVIRNWSFTRTGSKSIYTYTTISIIFIIHSNFVSSVDAYMQNVSTILCYSSVVLLPVRFVCAHVQAVRSTHIIIVISNLVFVLDRLDLPNMKNVSTRGRYVSLLIDYWLRVYLVGFPHPESKVITQPGAYYLIIFRWHIGGKYKHISHNDLFTKISFALLSVHILRE